MQRLDPQNTSCRVFTYKEGLLSAIAHDLELSVTDFTIELDEGSDGVTLDARFSPSSLRVVRAVTGSISERDKATIEKNIQEEVLHTRRHSEIRFRYQGPKADTVTGQLSLHGQERPQRVSIRSEANQRIAEATIHQPDFGIKPYTAMMGTLRIRADVRVVVTTTVRA